MWHGTISEKCLEGDAIETADGNIAISCFCILVVIGIGFNPGNQTVPNSGKGNESFSGDGSNRICSADLISTVPCHSDI